MPMLVIVQPWFSTLGHPAQSLINTAKIISNTPDITYLISMQVGSNKLDGFRNQLIQFGDVVEYPVKTTSTREGTWKALWYLRMLASKRRVKVNSVFFFDAHLVLLSILWPLTSFFLKPDQLSVINLMGPERIFRSKIATWFVRRFLKRKEVYLYLRTEELMLSWQEGFPDIPIKKIKYLISLEIPDTDVYTTPAADVELKFGIIGQVRKGKGLEWIVPMFKKNGTIGRLTVAGTFNNDADRERMAELQDFSGFNNKYLSESELLLESTKQDYLLVLYEDWDSRMESAVVYLAARVNRPVIVYDNGWCGRIIRKFGNGLFAPNDQASMPEFLSNLPRPGSADYNKLLEGVTLFRQANSGEVVRKAFLNAINTNYVS